MKIKSKVETIEEYIARGGTVKRLPIQGYIKRQDVSKTQGGPAIIMSLEEADLFYGKERPNKKKRTNIEPKLDINALPEQLRAKFLARLKDEDV